MHVYFLFLFINTKEVLHEPKSGFDILRSANKSGFLSIKAFNALQLVEKNLIWKRLSSYAVWNVYVHRHRSYSKFSVLGEYINLNLRPVKAIYNNNLRDRLPFVNLILAVMIVVISGVCLKTGQCILFISMLIVPYQK